MSINTQPLPPAATTQTTRLLWPMVTTRTARLRAALRRFDPYELAIVGTLLVVVLVAAVRANLPLLTGATPDRQAIIILVATVQPTPALPTPVATSAPVPTAAPELAAAPAATFHIDAAPEPTAGYIAHTTAGDLFVPADATPVPAGEVYTGPFLAPAATEVPPANAVRLCTGFGDWRDYDPMYAASPACQPVTQ